jgi:hypothetical protein
MFHLETLEQMLARRVHSTLILDGVIREVREAIIRLVLVVEKNLARLPSFVGIMSPISNVTRGSNFLRNGVGDEQGLAELHVGSWAVGWVVAFIIGGIVGRGWCAERNLRGVAWLLRLV